MFFTPEFMQQAGLAHAAYLGAWPTKEKVWQLVRIATGGSWCLQKVIVKK